MEDTAPHLKVEIERSGGPVKVVAVGEIDAATSPMLTAAIEEALKGGPADVELDLGLVTFIDSSGLRAITIAERDAEDAGRGFIVAAASDPVRKIFAMTGLGALLAG